MKPNTGEVSANSESLMLSLRVAILRHESFTFLLLENLFFFKYSHSEMEIASYISLKKEITGCTGQLKNNFIQAITSKDNKNSAKYIR